MKSNKHAVVLRKANLLDVDFYLSLKNDKTVRSSSFNTKLVDFKTHNNWLRNKLKKINSFLYVIEANYKRAGQIRFEIENDHAEVHISILPEYRGRGIAVTAIKKACKVIYSKNLGIGIITAHIKLKNTASKKTFLSAGFKEADIKFMQHSNCVEMVLSR